jgi:hypothetical protein
MSSRGVVKLPSAARRRPSTAQGMSSRTRDVDLAELQRRCSVGKLARVRQLQARVGGPASQEETERRSTRCSYVGPKPELLSIKVDLLKSEFLFT